MERLRPLDLEKTQFKSSFRGYDKATVDLIVARAAREIETLLGELKHAQETATHALTELEHFRAQESTLKEALILAQKASDETRANAHKQAELIEEQAQQRALELERQAQQKVRDLRWEIERLSLDRHKFEQRLRSLLDEHMRLLDIDRPYQPVLVNLELQENENPEQEPQTFAG